MSRQVLLGAVILLALLGTASVASAQMGDQAALVKKRDAKLAEPFLKNAEWVTDYDEALKRAVESKKIIFGYFTRSYAG